MKTGTLYVPVFYYIIASVTVILMNVRILLCFFVVLSCSKKDTTPKTKIVHGVVLHIGDRSPVADVDVNQMVYPYFDSIRYIGKTNAKGEYSAEVPADITSARLGFSFSKNKMVPYYIPGWRL